MLIRDENPESAVTGFLASEVLVTMKSDALEVGDLKFGTLSK